MKTQQYKQNFSQYFPQIYLHPSISKKQIQESHHNNQFHSQFLTLIFYNYLQTPALQQCLEIPLQAEGQLCLVKKVMNTRKINLNQGQQPCFQYFLLYMVNQNNPLDFSQKMVNKQPSQSQKQLKHLAQIFRTLISLCDKIIVLSLDNEKQTFIQKVFVQSILMYQKIKWQNPKSKIQRLSFIRQCYHQQENVFKSSSNNSKNSKQNTKQQQNNQNDNKNTPSNPIRYFGSLLQYKKYNDRESQKYKKKKYELQLNHERNFIFQLTKQKKVVKRISLMEILLIYQKLKQLISSSAMEFSIEDIIPDGKAQKQDHQGSRLLQNYNKQFFSKVSLYQPWKVRYYLQKLYELQTVSNLYRVIQHEIFYPNTTQFSVQFVYKQILKYLSYSTSRKSFPNLSSRIYMQNSQYLQQHSFQVALGFQSREKLLWKLTRLQKYQKQLQQESKISPHISEDKLISQLSHEEITFWAEKHINHWLQISFHHLKIYFNRIANLKDNKAIQEFRQECQKMNDNICSIDQQNFEETKKNKICYMKEQLNTFIVYHQDLLQGNNLSALKYVLKEIPYSLKYRKNIKNKSILFALIVILALMQKNIIAGITIGTLALIVLAIRL